MTSRLRAAAEANDSNRAEDAPFSAAAAARTISAAPTRNVFINTKSQPRSRSLARELGYAGTPTGSPLSQRSCGYRCIPSYRGLVTLILVFFCGHIVLSIYAPSWESDLAALSLSSPLLPPSRHGATPSKHNSQHAYVARVAELVFHAAETEEAVSSFRWLDIATEAEQHIIVMPRPPPFLTNSSVTRLNLNSIECGTAIVEAFSPGAVVHRVWLQPQVPDSEIDPAAFWHCAGLFVAGVVSPCTIESSTLRDTSSSSTHRASPDAAALASDAASTDTISCEFPIASEIRAVFDVLGIYAITDSIGKPPVRVLFHGHGAMAAYSFAALSTILSPEDHPATMLSLEAPIDAQACASSSGTACVEIRDGAVSRATAAVLAADLVVVPTFRIVESIFQAAENVELGLRAPSTSTYDEADARTRSSSTTSTSAAALEQLSVALEELREALLLRPVLLFPVAYASTNMRNASLNAVQPTSSSSSNPAAITSSTPPLAYIHFAHALRVNRSMLDDFRTRALPWTANLLHFPRCTQGTLDPEERDKLIEFVHGEGAISNSRDDGSSSSSSSSSDIAHYNNSASVRNIAHNVSVLESACEMARPLEHISDDGDEQQHSPRIKWRGMGWQPMFHPSPLYFRARSLLGLEGHPATSVALVLKPSLEALKVGAMYTFSLSCLHPVLLSSDGHPVFSASEVGVGGDRGNATDTAARAAAGDTELMRLSADTLGCPTAIRFSIYCRVASTASSLLPGDVTRGAVQAAVVVTLVDGSTRMRTADFTHALRHRRRTGTSSSTGTGHVGRSTGTGHGDAPGSRGEVPPAAATGEAEDWDVEWTYSQFSMFMWSNVAAVEVRLSAVGFSGTVEFESPQLRVQRSAELCNCVSVSDRQ